MSWIIRDSVGNRTPAESRTIDGAIRFTTDEWLEWDQEEEDPQLEAIKALLKKYEKDKEKFEAIGEEFKASAKKAEEQALTQGDVKLAMEKYPYCTASANGHVLRWLGNNYGIAVWQCSGCKAIISNRGRIWRIEE